jgi:hypothetical protein
MLICILGALLLQVRPVLADTHASAKTDPQTQEETEAKRKTLMSDATAALAETQGALRLLDGGKMTPVSSEGSILRPRAPKSPCQVL